MKILFLKLPKILKLIRGRSLAFLPRMAQVFQSQFCSSWKIGIFSQNETFSDRIQFSGKYVKNRKSLFLIDQPKVQRESHCMLIIEVVPSAIETGPRMKAPHLFRHWRAWSETLKNGWIFSNPPLLEGEGGSNEKQFFCL